MSFLKFFLIREPRREPEGAYDRWRGDPLGHPDLAEMSLRELADLPLPASVFEAPAESRPMAKCT
ncbi:hypothetical protein [Rhizobium binxianense]